jgi:hypothetical protein
MYFRLMRDPDARRKGLNVAAFGEQTRDGFAWNMGQKFSRPIDHEIRCVLNARGGTELPDAVLYKAIPLFSGRFLDLLRSSGVDNIDAYPASVVDVAGNVLEKRYWAVNLVGLIACVDRDASSFDSNSREPLLELRKLVVDIAKTRGALMFRLAERPSFILVAESVRAAIDGVDLIDVRALPLDDPRVY